MEANAFITSCVRHCVAYFKAALDALAVVKVSLPGMGHHAKTR